MVKACKQKMDFNFCFFFLVLEMEANQLKCLLWKVKNAYVSQI